MKRPNFEALKQLDRRLVRESPVDYRRNFEFFDALYDEAVAFGVWGTGRDLKDIDVDIKYARVINAAVPSRQDRKGP
jgi:hypothetical protein